jgi:hypothetical protein
MPPRNRGADAARPWTAAGIIAVGASLEQRAAPSTRQFVRDGDVPVEVLHGQDNSSRVNQLAATREALQDMHRRLWEVVPYLPLGQFVQPFLWRSNISGVLRSNVLAFWNISKA